MKVKHAHHQPGIFFAQPISSLSEVVSCESNSSTAMQLNISVIVPDRKSVLQSQGMKDDHTVPEKINEIVDEAIDLFSSVARPVGLLSELTKSEFERIFEVEGKNEEETPVQHIFPQSENLALFAVTMGSRVSEKITELFNGNCLMH